MSLFNLKDIRYTKDLDRKFTPVSKKYDTSVLKYPIDVGSADKGHYMLIHINVQEKSSFAANFSNDLPTIFRNRNRTNLAGNLQNSINGITGSAQQTLKNATDEIEAREYALAWGGEKFDAATVAGRNVLNLISSGRLAVESIQNNPAISNILQGVSSSLTEKPLDNVSFLRKIKRTKDSIALYMPNTLSFTHNQSYTDLQLGGENLAGAAAIGSVISDNLRGNFDISNAISNLSPFIASALSQSGRIAAVAGQNSLRALFASAFGVVQNPMLELIYTRPDFRSFRFDFMFHPRSEKEAIEIHEIIQRLYFHQAPELSSGSAGYFLVPPSEFDIEFYYNGVQNPNIPKISTCVLTSIDVDYAPNGFTAYEVPGQNTPSPGGTGTPVSIRMSLNFKETEIVTKSDYGQRLKSSGTRPEVSGEDNAAAIGGI